VSTLTQLVFRVEVALAQHAAVGLLALPVEEAQHRAGGLGALDVVVDLAALLRMVWIARIGTGQTRRFGT
jgi:hypothetical protein